MFQTALQFWIAMVLLIAGAVSFFAGTFNTGFRAAFSSGRPWLPMSIAGRVTASIGGALLFLVGVVRICTLIR